MKKIDWSKVRNWFISQDEHVSSFFKILLATGLLIFVSLMLFACFALMQQDHYFMKLIGLKSPIDNEARLILLVLISGALGSSIHTITSFTRYIGHNMFYTRWIWWYLMRPFAGGALALVFYFVIRGGLFTGNVSTEINFYGIMAISGLVGMFSKQATDKLNELFTNLFKTQSDGDKTDAISEDDNESENPS
jgi:hypothetical protein